MNFVKSPLNYTGGKFKLLPQIVPLFPQRTDCFYDLFCGGGNVAVNASSSSIIACDIQKEVMELFNYFSKNDTETVIKQVEAVIKDYKLTNSFLRGYDYYAADSSGGLGASNKNNFHLLRKDYNSGKIKHDKNIVFYTLVVFGFNNQIRFNSSGEFNISVGKRDFNKSNRTNLKNFIEKIHSKNITFLNKSYDKISFDLSVQNFIYADPPYLISTATYNENGGWGEEDEKKLLEFLLNSHRKDIKFALSNILEHKNKENTILLNWAKKNKFHVHEIQKNYKNSSYQSKEKTSPTREVLVTNYK